MAANTHRLATRLIHAGEPAPVDGAVVLPIFQSATFASRPDESYDDLRYIRLNNTPNHTALHAKLAAVTGAQDALVTASGMAAIAAVLATLLKSGDHLLTQDCLYGGTYALLRQELPDMGIQHTPIAGNAPDTWEEKLQPTTRVIYVETMTNPLLEVADLEAVAAFAKAHGLISVIDNTFASPVNFRPLELGFDLEIHSATKYLNGHSDLVAGAIAGHAAHIARIRQRLNRLGAVLDPHACFLLHRGLKTLLLRVQQQNANAQTLAAFLAAHPDVAHVHYPGLDTHPQYARADRLFAGCGGVLSFALQNGEADNLIQNLRLATSAPSLGGVETLITRPSKTSHASLSPQDRHSLGITDDLIRVAVGIEADTDLIADFSQALDRI